MVKVRLTTADGYRVWFDLVKLRTATLLEQRSFTCVCIDHTMSILVRESADEIMDKIGFGPEVQTLARAELLANSPTEKLARPGWLYRNAK
jgi:hypothetical protein